MNIKLKKNRVEELCYYLPSRLLFIFMTVFGMVLLFDQSSNAQCVLDCRNEVEIALYSNEDLTVRPEMILNNPYGNCPGASFNVKIYDDAGNLLGNVVNASHIGLPLIAVVTNVNNGMSCNSSLMVIDDIPPQIDCQDVFIGCTEEFTPEILGLPHVSDNIDDIDSSALTYRDIYKTVSCMTVVQDSVISDWVERIWEAADSSGNIGTCIQNIYFLRKTFDDIDFPVHRDGIEAPFLDCGTQSPDDLILCGTPSIDGQSILANAHCEFFVTYTDNSTVNCTGDQRIIRTWSVTDWCLDSTVYKIQIIRIKDTLSPVLSTVDTMYFYTNQDKCSATVLLDMPEAIDSCSVPVVEVHWQFGNGPGPFNYIPVGTYPVN